MVTNDLMNQAAARGLRVEQHFPEQPDRLSVVTGSGRVLGTLLPAADGVWVAVPANVPVEVGNADDTLDYLAGLEQFQTYVVQVMFDRTQTRYAASNEDVLLSAIRQATDWLDEGRPEVIIVGGSSLELGQQSDSGR